MRFKVMLEGVGKVWWSVVEGKEEIRSSVIMRTVCSFMTEIGREGVSRCLGVGGCLRVCVRVFRRSLGSLVRFGCVKNLFS